jgi:phosphatidylethanolamine-binding protein (PEBP) family uncharacterized protein
MRRLLVALLGLVTLVACGGHEPSLPDPSGSRSITVTSPAFGDGEAIPPEYTCKGAGTAPEIQWSGILRDVGSFALVVDDPDAPGGDYVHWIVVGIPPGGGPSDGSSVRGWKPPCPPSGTHHYRFTVYAVPDGQTSSLEGEASPTAVIAWIADQAVAWGRLTGTVTAK